MWTKKERPSKLLLILGEYFGFAILCGFFNALFFQWASIVIVGNYELNTGKDVPADTEYLIDVVIMVASVIMAAFVLVLLLQRKFAYMIEISHAVEEMEAGNLVKRIPIVGDDELADLAMRINGLAETVEEGIRASEQMKQERFNGIASLSHDIRTPLTSVMSYLQFIRDQQYNDTHQLLTYADKAYEKAYRIKEMTDNLFENCIKDIEVTQPLEKIEGNVFLKQVLFDTQDFLETSGFTVQISETKEFPPFFLQINREKMARIFDNLISNIEKYADSSQPIRLQAIVEGNQFILRQENTKIIEHKKNLVESHLVGLKGVEKMLHKMGGELSVEEVGHIFRIQLTLPLV